VAKSSEEAKFRAMALGISEIMLSKIILENFNVDWINL